MEVLLHTHTLKNKGGREPRSLHPHATMAHLSRYLTFAALAAAAVAFLGRVERAAAWTYDDCLNLYALKESCPNGNWDDLDTNWPDTRPANKAECGDLHDWKGVGTFKPFGDQGEGQFSVSDLPQHVGDTTEDEVMSLVLADAGFLQNCSVLPAELALLPFLRFVNLANAGYSSSEIPSEWGKPSFGEVPCDRNGEAFECGSFRQLRALVLEGMDLQGSIPASLGDIATLGVLNLSNNALTGSIPASLGNYRTMRTFDLSRNDLSGRIPTELADMTKLGVLDEFIIHNNPRLQGTLPSAFCDPSTGLYVDTHNTDVDCGNSYNVPATLVIIFAVLVFLVCIVYCSWKSARRNLQAKAGVPKKGSRAASVSEGKGNLV